MSFETEEIEFICDYGLRKFEFVEDHLETVFDHPVVEIDVELIEEIGENMRFDLSAMLSHKVVPREYICLSIIHDIMFKREQLIVACSNNPTEMQTLSNMMLSLIDHFKRKYPNLIKVHREHGKKVKRITFANSENVLELFTFVDACHLKGCTIDTFYFDGYYNAIEELREEFRNVRPACKTSIQTLNKEL